MSDAADGLEAAELYLDPHDLAGVPGVLGEISRARLTDYLQGEAQTARAIRAELSARPQRPSFRAALEGPCLSLIAEVKRASPSRGVIAELEPSQAALAYARGGAQALSVLTEPRRFGGALAHVAQVAAVCELPILRKDFTVHPAQLAEAASAGASAVLLIAAVLGERMGVYLALARDYGLDALVEVHDDDELALALEAGAELIGVNNRDLRTLRVDLGNAPRLMRRARALGFSGLLVAESGYSQAAELQALAGLADAVLVGSSLAGSGDLEASTRWLLGGGSNQP